MNVTAAEELVELIMLDDFVSRRKALNRWTRRWIATLPMEYELNTKNLLADAIKRTEEVMKHHLAEKLTDALLDTSVKALRWQAQVSLGETQQVKAVLSVVLAEPRELT